MSISTTALEPKFYDSHHESYGRSISSVKPTTALEPQLNYFQHAAHGRSISGVEPTTAFEPQFYASHHVAHDQLESRHTAISNALRAIYMKQMTASAEIIHECWQAVRDITAQYSHLHSSRLEVDAAIAPVMAIVQQQTTLEDEARANFEAL